MAKGLKMAAARMKNCGTKVLKIYQLCKSNNGNMICEFCPAEVQYVSAHTRGASKTPVVAYLKLWQNAEHRDDCPNTIDVAVDKLVARSRDIEGIPQIFQPDQQGNYKFRMNILIESMEVARQASNMDSGNNNLKRVVAGKKYVHSGHHLASYFRSASGLARIRTLLQEASDVSLFTQRLKIEYKDNILSWNDFYYDQSRYPILFRRLSHGKISHPIAVKVTIKSNAEKSKKAGRFPWSFQCYGEPFSEMDKVLRFIPRLRFEKEDFPKILFPKNTVLVVGNAWADKTKQTNNNFRNFSIAIYHKSQICEELETQ